jgi:hypothetical protein
MEDQKYYENMNKVRNSDSDDLTFWEYMRTAEQSEQALNEIPKAHLHQIIMDKEHYGYTIDNTKKIMAVVVDGNIVATVSRHYKLVQHKDAFEPIFTALHKTATPYDFALLQTDTKAFVKVFVDEIGDNGSGIKLGFEARNSIDGKGAINYSMTSTKLTRRKTTVVEVVGLRLACKNGMKVRVPLDQAEEIKIDIRTEIQEKAKELLRLATNIIHMGEVEKKIEAVQYVTEAMTLLKEPIAQIIQSAKEKEIGEKYAKELIAKYIGKRLSQRIYEQFQREDRTIWGLYNAITYVASHGVKVPTMNGLIDRSADLLEQEITIKQKN